MDVHEARRKADIGVGITRHDVEIRTGTQIESEIGSQIIAVVEAAAQDIESGDIGAPLRGSDVWVDIGPGVAARRHRNLAGQFEGRGDILEIVEQSQIVLVFKPCRDSGPDTVLARLQAIIETSNGVPGRSHVEPAPAEAAVSILDFAVILAD